MTMTDQTESTTAALLRDLDSAAAGIQRLDRLDAESAATAIRTLEAKAAAAEAALQELLARIHRDGGHYAAEHGTEKAAEDADAIVAALFADRDRLAGEVERIRVQFDEAIARIKDMLEDDDGQAFKEAGKFLLHIKGRDDEA